MGNLIGEYLREQRKLNNLSTQEAANRAGVANQMVCFIENGQRHPSFYMITKLAVAIGVTDLNEAFRLRNVELIKEALIECDAENNEHLIPFLKSVDVTFANRSEKSIGLAEKINETLILTDTLNKTAQELAVLYDAKDLKVHKKQKDYGKKKDIE